MRILSFLFLICNMLFASAQQHAVQVLDYNGQLALETWCKDLSKSYVLLPQERTIIISDASVDDLTPFGFVSKVRQIENQIVFNTNVILVKTKDNSPLKLGALSIDYKLIPHNFIPKLYYVHCAVKEDSELIPVLQSIKMLSNVHQLETKQVFTIQASSNDPIFNRQWSIENNGTPLQSNGITDADMDVDSAWTISEGDSTIKIAILDSGVDTIHEDLIDNMLSGFDGFATDSTDTKGYPTPNFSSDGHGTACAGIAAAISNNNKGIAGIAPNCKIVPIRIFYYQDYGGSVGVQATTNTDALISGSAFAWRVANVDIMSTSAGLSPLFIGVLSINTQLVTDEINESFSDGRNGYGVPMFFSAGNDDFDDVLWPGDLHSTIAVGASTMCDERKNPNDCSPENWGSSYGLSLDVVAPGVRISTTDMTGFNGYTNNSYTNTFNGTSAACPNAAGVGALILSFSPGLHARDVKAVLNLSAERVGGYSYDSTGTHGTWNEEMGHGRVNAFYALKLAETYATSVGIGDDKISKTLQLFPNPSYGMFSILNPSKLPMELNLYTITGDLIKQFNLTMGRNDFKVNLPPGMYFIQSHDGFYQQKVIFK